MMVAMVSTKHTYRRLPWWSWYLGLSTICCWVANGINLSKLIYLAAPYKTHLPLKYLMNEARCNWLLSSLLTSQHWPLVVAAGFVNFAFTCVGPFEVISTTSAVQHGIMASPLFVFFHLFPIFPFLLFFFHCPFSSFLLIFHH